MRKLLLILLFCSMCIGQLNQKPKPLGEQNFSPSILSFNNGEVSPRFEQRADFKKYKSSLRTAENVLAHTQGPISRRPGTRYVATIPAADFNEPNRPDVDPTKIGISTMAQLALIGNHASYPLDGDYQLLNDLDADGITFWPIGYNSSNPELDEQPFTGTFDGRYYTISNLSYTIAKNFSDHDFFTPASWDNFGLFASISGSVSNLTVSNMEITCAWDIQNLSESGLLAAIITGTGTVTNVHIQGSINISASGAGIGTGISLFGGFCSALTGSVVHCSSDLTFIATHNGSLSRIGGFSAAGTGGSFTDCYATGSITHVGGTMTQIGGFCGSVAPDVPKSWTNIYSAVVITGTVASRVGGLIGYYNTFFDDIHGHQHITFSDCFWDATIQPADYDDVGNLGDFANITEETTTNMYKEATFTNWDFTPDTGVWEIEEDVAYPLFQWYVTSSKLPRETGNDEIRLIAFEYSTDDSYVIEAGNSYFRFYRDDGL